MKWVAVAVMAVMLPACTKPDAEGVETHLFPYPSGDIKVAVWPRGNGVFDAVAFHPASETFRIPSDSAQSERAERLRLADEVINDGRCGPGRHAVMVDEFQKRDINTMRWECKP